MGSEIDTRLEFLGPMSPPARRVLMLALQLRRTELTTVDLLQAIVCDEQPDNFARAALLNIGVQPGYLLDRMLATTTDGLGRVWDQDRRAAVKPRGDAADDGTPTGS